ncbi:DUF6731 family protein [Comamonas sp. JUb58]|uniref:DUF6731 family protein n=1 Tax=Comamonas sp. JUb58 TaxID=2485114 RepID=UPI001061E00A|nr:DUF6731 family protein [Comamonas sp. JUb58]TDS82603.1 hypothetical protein EDF71_107239 [Comamonas sp. JUb58]
MKTIKVYCYLVNQAKQAKPLEDVLQAIAAKPLEDRILDCGGQRIRIDDVQKKQFTNGDDYWLVRFCKFQDDNWPGVSTTAEAVKDLDLDDDQILSEETSILYLPKNSKLVIQYNHYGVRASRIKEYLSISEANTPQAYSFIPVLTNDAAAKYGHKQIVTEVEACIDGVTMADVALLQGTGIEGALKQSVDAHGTSYKFSVSVDARIKKNKLDRSWVERLVEKIKSRSGDNDSLFVTAKHSEEEQVETIDLLESRKFSVYKANSIDRTTGKRYDPIQLYGLLEQTMKDWI